VDINRFTWLFDYVCPGHMRNVPQPLHSRDEGIKALDPCPDVSGMTSINKQRLLNVGFFCLDPGEAYLEVGTYNGKSLIGAVLGNPARPVHACDDFSEFQGSNTLNVLQANLARYEILTEVQFHNGDFRQTFATGRVDSPVGLYFYDGAHDELSQYEGIALAEPLLADQALVIVDDWRLAADSGSYAEAGTMRAVSESQHQWELLHVLPARYNGDLEMWWNGVAVLSFRRNGAARGQAAA
jgi:predicted O-methyltransferase YrrM